MVVSGWMTYAGGCAGKVREEAIPHQGGPKQLVVTESWQRGIAYGGLYPMSLLPLGCLGPAYVCAGR